MAEPNSKESSSGNDSDQDFDPSAEMLVNDFDDEHTLDEEEAIGEEDAKEEIDELTKEGNMPIEELLAMYGVGNEKDGNKTSDTIEEKGNNPGQSGTPHLTSQQSANASSSASVSGRITSGGSFANMSDSDDSESDDEFSANEDEWRRTIQVGSDYQAVIPEGLCSYTEQELREQESTIYVESRREQKRDILVWKPTTIDDEQLDEYVKMYDGFYDEETPILPIGEHNRDDDHALYLLLLCDYNIAEALKRHQLNPNPPAGATPVRKMMDPWTEEECRAFESGLRTYGKDFFLIKHNKIPTRNVGEVVTFYYFWKKTERHDQFVTKFRVEKKKYALHPGTTDYMDRFLDEQENMTVNSSNLGNSIVSSHNAGSLLSSAASHHQLNHLNISSSSSRQSNSTHGISSAQSKGYHQNSMTHSSKNDSYVFGNNSASVTITSGNNMRTINVNASGEPQTILINDSDFKPSNQSDKPIVVCTGNSGSSSSNKSNYFHNNNSSHNHASMPSSDTTTTIVVGKNPVVIDGVWVSSSSSSTGTTSNSPTSLSTPSVSIYKIPNNSSGFNR